MFRENVWASLRAVAHFRPYVVGRRFKLITDCSARIRLILSGNVSPKLHRWALRLTEYDMELLRKSAVSHQLPDASTGRMSLDQT